MRFLLLAAAAIVLTVESPVLHAADQTPLKALPAIDPAAVLGHVKTLASDAFEGRAPGTPGEEKTVAYLVEAFKKLGLKPGNPDGTYVQKVPLVGITAAAAPLTITGGAGRPARGPRRWRWRDDVVAWTKRVTEEVKVDASELVFVGYGVQAPEYGWDDYKGVDVAGKTLVMLVNDPPVPDSGVAVGARREDVRRPGHDLLRPLDLQVRDRREAQGRRRADRPRDRPGRLSVRGRAGQDRRAVHLRHARQEHGPRGHRGLDHARPGQGALHARRAGLRPAQGAGRDAGLHAGAARPDRVDDDPQHAAARRLAERRGPPRRRRPAVKDEHVVFTAHWDHFGVGEPINGDRIYNGAKDNATGTGRAPRDRARVHAAAEAAAPIDPVPRGDGGGAGAARLGVLRRAAAVSAGEDARRHQHGRAERERPHQGPGHHRPRRVGAGRLRPGRGEGAGADAQAGRRAGEGLLLPLRSLQLRQAWACRR